MATTTVHQGPHTSIPPTASPGLLFLKTVLPLLDSLDESDLTTLLPTHLAPDATFTLNNSPALPVAQVLGMLGMRAARVARFGHDVTSAWDIAAGEGGRRTVMFESTSFTVFKGDGEGVEVRVREFGVVELVEGEGGRLMAVGLRTYMDSSPVTERAKVVMGKRKGGEGKDT